MFPNILHTLLLKIRQPYGMNNIYIYSDWHTHHIITLQMGTYEIVSYDYTISIIHLKLGLLGQIYCRSIVTVYSCTFLLHVMT